MACESRLRQRYRACGIADSLMPAMTLEVLAAWHLAEPPRPLFPFPQWRFGIPMLIHFPCIEHGDLVQAGELRGDGLKIDRSLYHALTGGSRRENPDGIFSFCKLNKRSASCCNAARLGLAYAVFLSRTLISSWLVVFGRGVGCFSGKE